LFSFLFQKEKQMKIQDVFDGAIYLSDVVQKTYAHKLTMTVGDDFSVYSDLVAQYRPTQPLGRPFDPTHTVLTGGNAIWIVGRNAEGAVVHTHAMRMIDLCDQSLAQYLAHRYVDFPPPGVTIDAAASWFRAGPGAEQITGRAVYHGEMWLADDPAYRGSGLIDALARFAFLTAALHWQPDFLFGFIVRSIARRGLAEREGYMHSDPYCLSWAVAETGAPIDCNMVWMALRDMCHIMHVPLVDRLSA
jgi:hypothetical protein